MEGVVIEGYGAASGRNRFTEIGGTIKAQKPFFETLGVDCRDYFNGTINVDISPMEFVPLRSKATLVNVKWHPKLPAENFSFFDCSLTFDQKQFGALVYLPHQETKTGFAESFPPPTTLEFLAPRIDGLAYGAKIAISSPSGSIGFRAYQDPERKRFYSAHGPLVFLEI